MNRATSFLLSGIFALSFALATPALALNPQPLPPGFHAPSGRAVSRPSSRAITASLSLPARDVPPLITGPASIVAMARAAPPRGMGTEAAPLHPAITWPDSCDAPRRSPAQPPAWLP